MRISFIGTTTIAEKFAKHIHNFYKEQENKSDYNNLKLEGFYCEPTSEVTRITLPLNCKIYVTLEDMVRDNDIIAILCKENQIKYYAKEFEKLEVKNKIFFHMSDKYNCDVLDIGKENTYASIYLPVNLYVTTPITMSEFPFVMEGTGSRLDLFEKVLNHNNINTTCVSRENANTFLSACKMLEMNLVSILSGANTAIMASTNINLNNYTTLLAHNMGKIITNRDGYIKSNISRYLNALSIDSCFKSINRLDMTDYTKMNKYACDICTRLADIPNDDKLEIELVTKKYSR